jgi:hypothetical protein
MLAVWTLFHLGSGKAAQEEARSTPDQVLMFGPRS